MCYSSPKQLCFPPVIGQTIRADFEGGALSSDCGALLLRGVDRQIGLTARLAAAIHDKRISPILITRCVTCWPNASIKSLRGMRTETTQIASAWTPCSNSAWSDL